MGWPPSTGVLFNPALVDFVAAPDHGLGHLAAIPDRCWLDHGIGAQPRFEPLLTPTRLLLQAAQRLPVVLHGIGLSICSAEVFDVEYLEHLAAWRERLGCAWVSEHLSFTRIGGGDETNAAMALASPCDQEMLELLVPRLQRARQILGAPLLLENAVSYTLWCDEEMSDTAFLNRLAAESGCGLLLDLHNLYTNAYNHGFDACEWIDALDTAAVREVHVAGGDVMHGMHTDSHAGPVCERVWPLLEHLLPRAPNLQAVTFEFHEASWPLLHEAGVRAQIARMRECIAAAHAPA